MVENNLEGKSHIIGKAARIAGATVVGVAGAVAIDNTAAL